MAPSWTFSTKEAGISSNLALDQTIPMGDAVDQI